MNKCRLSSPIKWILIFLLTQGGIANAQILFSLQAAIDTARIRSPFLKASGYNVNIAQGTLVTARLHTNPVLNNQTLQMTNSKYFSPGTEAGNALNRQVWWQLTKPFVLPGQRRNRIDLASQNVLAEQRHFAETSRTFSTDVANQWLEAWIIKSRLDILTLAYSNIDSLVGINRARFRNQVITQTDVIRTQLLQDQYKLQIINAQKDYRVLTKQLQFLIGVSDSVDVDIVTPIETISVPGQLDSLLERARRERTDVQAAKLALLLAQTNIKYQKSMAWPQPELGMIWNPQNTIPYLGFFGTIKVPIFDRNQGEIEKSKYFEKQAQEGIRSTDLRLTTEVRSAFEAYQVERENLKKYDLMMLQSDQVLDNVRYAYLRGGTTIIDFLDAQRSWFDTRKLFLDARLSYFQSYLQLLYVTGLINQL